MLERSSRADDTSSPSARPSILRQIHESRILESTMDALSCNPLTIMQLLFLPRPCCREYHVRFDVSLWTGKKAITIRPHEVRPRMVYRRTTNDYQARTLELKSRSSIYYQIRELLPSLLLSCKAIRLYRPPTIQGLAQLYLYMAPNGAYMYILQETHGVLLMMLLCAVGITWPRQRT